MPKCKPSGAYFIIGDDGRPARHISGKVMIFPSRQVARNFLRNRYRNDSTPHHYFGTGTLAPYKEK